MLQKYNIRYKKLYNREKNARPTAFQQNFQYKYKFYTIIFYFCFQPVKALKIKI